MKAYLAYLVKIILDMKYKQQQKDPSFEGSFMNKLTNNKLMRFTVNYFANRIRQY